MAESLFMLLPPLFLLMCITEWFVSHLSWSSCFEVYLHLLDSCVFSCLEGTLPIQSLCAAVCKNRNWIKGVLPLKWISKKKKKARWEKSVCAQITANPKSCVSSVHWVGFQNRNRICTCSLKSPWAVKNSIIKTVKTLKTLNWNQPENWWFYNT